MGGKLFWTGLVLTVAYLGGIVALSGDKLLSLGGLELNAIGDFFAGAFAPPAFLWLVLGFIQQGSELKASVATLRLQAEELAQSVEQQKELVKVTKDQLKHDSELLRLEIERYNEQYLPKLYFDHYGGGGNSDGKLYNIRISNTGAPLTDFRMTLRQGDHSETYVVPVMETNYKHPHQFKGFPTNCEDKMFAEIYYRSMRGQIVKEIYSSDLKSEGLVFERLSIESFQS